VGDKNSNLPLPFCLRGGHKEILWCSYRCLIVHLKTPHSRLILTHTLEGRMLHRETDQKEFWDLLWLSLLSQLALGHIHFVQSHLDMVVHASVMSMQWRSYTYSEEQGLGSSWIIEHIEVPGGCHIWKGHGSSMPLLSKVDLCNYLCLIVFCIINW
jgi:hypothetical protein